MNNDIAFFNLNNGAHKIVLSNFGASIISIIVKDKNNNWVDVIVGPETKEQLIMPTAKYYGSTIGRYANRIENGKFTLNNNHYNLPINNGPNHLHGGLNGFDSKIWEVKNQTENEINFQYLSVDGEEGYPGNVIVNVCYTLTEIGIDIVYTATTDADTIINVTNHAFFNLNGGGSMLNHQLQINAEKYLPINNVGIPFGPLALVENTPFDFLTQKSIGQNINDNNEQIKNGNGYDHSFEIKQPNNLFNLAAIAHGDLSGITLKVYTTQPSIHLYTGNFMEGANIFKLGQLDSFRSAFCLEAQHYPNSPNNNEYPKTILKAGEEFNCTIKYNFY